MQKLLVQQWGLSERFALEVINLYGGHLYNAYRALIRLRKMKENFFAFDADQSSKIDECFDEKVDKYRLSETLKLLAQTGFAPLSKRNDPVAEALSNHNVAGVVKKASLTVGLPKRVWKDDNDYGLVPSSQSTRLLIARYLVKIKKI